MNQHRHIKQNHNYKSQKWSHWKIRPYPQTIQSIETTVKADQNWDILSLDTLPKFQRTINIFFTNQEENLRYNVQKLLPLTNTSSYVLSCSCR